jgi:hypothetical protein
MWSIWLRFANFLLRKLLCDIYQFGTATNASGWSLVGAVPACGFTDKIAFQWCRRE